MRRRTLHTLSLGIGAFLLMLVIGCHGSRYGYDRYDRCYDDDYGRRSYRRYDDGRCTTSRYDNDRCTTSRYDNHRRYKSTGRRGQGRYASRSYGGYDYCD